MRPVQRVHHDSDELPDRQVRPGEQRHGAHPPARAVRATAGAAPGSIIAAIIATHTAAKNANEPSRVATPISIPVICQTETTQHAAASPSVTVSAAAAAVLPALTVAAVLALVMAAGPLGARRRVPGPGSR